MQLKSAPLSSLPRVVFRFALAAAIAAAFMVTQTTAQQMIAGANVNLAGGPLVVEKQGNGFSRFEGDPAQRQNEVSCMVDSRNPQLIGCAYNDYTPVFVASLLGDGSEKETGDAWLGYSIVRDGGLSAKKYLLPGYPQDTSAEGLASPLHGYEAAADPTWRSWKNGISYLTGIVFNRKAVTGSQGSAGEGALFIQKWVNHNNRENDPEPLKRAGPPVILARSTGETFQDKPWVFIADNHDIHVVYATFLGGNRPHSSLWRTLCPGGNLGKCATTKLSEGDHVLNGTIVTGHHGTGWIDMAYRRRESPQTGGDTDAILFVRCTSKTACTKAQLVAAPPKLQRGDTSTLTAMFDQGSSKYSMRNVSNPAIATDAGGRVYVLWAERRQVNPWEPDAEPTGLIKRDSQIMLAIGTTNSAGAVTFSEPRAIDNLTFDPASPQPGPPFASPIPSGRGHELRPNAWFASGRLFVSAMIANDDQTIGVFTKTFAPDPGNPANKIVTYVESREPAGELSPAPATARQVGRAFTEFLFDLAPAQPTEDVSPTFNQRIARRHTFDVGLWSSATLPTAAQPLPTFTFTKVSRYKMAFRPQTGRFEQVQFNPLLKPLHCGGNCAFGGDYDDLVAPAWVPKSDGSGYVPNVSAADTTPVFVGWTDNRNLRTLGGSLTAFTSPLGAAVTGTACDPLLTGTRNQDPYLARAGAGLSVFTLGNQKPLNIQRAFPVVLQNGVNATKHYRAQIVNTALQGGTASWKQFASLGSLDISIPPFSMAVRQLYAVATDADATIRVNVVEIDAGGNIVPNGSQAFTIINPDRSTPDLLTPIDDGVIDTTDPASAEVHSPDETSPDETSANVDVTPDSLSLANTSPDETSPDETSVGAQYPDETSPDETSPDETSIPTDISPVSPDETSPDETSAALPEGTTITDTVITVTNTSNVTSAIGVETFVARPLPAGYKLQLMAKLPYYVPAPRGCELKMVNASQLLASVANPRLTTDATQLKFDPEDKSSQNMTVPFFQPGQRATLIYRLIAPAGGDRAEYVDQHGRRHKVSYAFNPAQDLVAVVTSQAVSTGGKPALHGKRVFPLITTTTAVPTAKFRNPYTVTLQTQGGVAPVTWSLISGSLPAGLTLSPAGVISGTPVVVGTFIFTVEATDASGDTARRRLTLIVEPGVAM